MVKQSINKLIVYGLNAFDYAICKEECLKELSPSALLLEKINCIALGTLYVKIAIKNFSAALLY